MCAILKDCLYPVYEIIDFNIAMLHFVSFHNVTCYTNSLLSHIHVNNTKFIDIKCTLVAICMISQRLRCS